MLEAGSFVNKTWQAGNEPRNFRKDYKARCQLQKRFTIQKKETNHGSNRKEDGAETYKVDSEE